MSISQVWKTQAATEFLAKALNPGLTVKLNNDTSRNTEKQRKLPQTLLAQPPQASGGMRVQEQPPITPGINRPPGGQGDFWEALLFLWTSPPRAFA